MSQALLAALPALWEMRLLYTPASSNTAVVERGCGYPHALPPSVASFALTIFSFQEIVPIMDLAVNEEFTRMYSEEELMGARRIQVHVHQSEVAREKEDKRVFPGIVAVCVGTLALIGLPRFCCFACWLRCRCTKGWTSVHTYPRSAPSCPLVFV